jgi:hypothetical protein
MPSRLTPLKTASRCLVYIIDHGVGSHTCHHGVHTPCHSAKCRTHKNDNGAHIMDHRLPYIVVGVESKYSNVSIYRQLDAHNKLVFEPIFIHTKR